MRIEGGAGIAVTGDQYLPVPTYLPNKESIPNKRTKRAWSRPVRFTKVERVQWPLPNLCAYLQWAIGSCSSRSDSGFSFLLPYRKDGVDPCCSPTSLLFPCVHDTAHQGRSRIYDITHFTRKVKGPVALAAPLWQRVTVSYDSSLEGSMPVD